MRVLVSSAGTLVHSGRGAMSGLETANALYNGR
jgi:hypothetical protein